MPEHAPEFVRTVTATMMAGRGDELPVSALPVDGTYPSGTTQYEKRNISDLVAVWDSGPVHPVRQLQLRLPAQRDPLQATTTPSALEGAPEGFRSAPLNAPGLPDTRYTLQVYVEDCTGCGLCVEACPVSARRRAGAQGDQPRRRASRCSRPSARTSTFFETLPADRPLARGLRHRARHPVPRAAVRVLRRLRRLRRDALPQAALAAVRRPPDGRQRDRLLVDLRRQPADHAVDHERRGPRARPGRTRCSRTTPSSGSACGSPPTATPSWPAAGSPSCATALGAELVDEILEAPQLRESELREQRERIAELERRLDGHRRPRRSTTCAA